MINKYNLTIFLLLITMNSAAYAEKWVSIGSNMYVDSTSKNRNGDLASLTLKFEGENQFLEFDCVNKKLVQHPKLIIEANSPFDRALKIACSKWYEFTK
jgi:hypothetical protein